MTRAAGVSGEAELMTAMRGGQGWAGLLVCAAMLGLFAPGSARAPQGAELDYPLAIAAGPAGEIYLADRSLPGVWKLTDGKLTLVFQGSKKFRTPLNAVRCVGVDAQGRVYAGDSATREVYRFNDQFQPEPLAHSATGTGIGIPMAIAFDKDQNLVVADLEFPGRVVKIPAGGGEPVVLAQVNAPRGLTVDGEGRVWVLTHGKDRQVVRLLPDGKVETVVEGQPFDFPQSIVLDDEGHAYVADGYAKAIWKIPAGGGEPVKLVEGHGLLHPDGGAIHKGELLVVDPEVRKGGAKGGATGVFRLTRTGQLTPVELTP